MKIIFKDSELNEGIINVSLDGGFTFTDYEIAEVKETGIPLDDSQDYEKIKIKGPANVLKNLDVLSSINTLYESNLLPEDITGLVLKDFNGKFDKSLLQKYPNLTNVTIPEGVTSISNYAFDSCSNLTSVIIPNSVTSIGYSAFQSCTGLTSITLPESLTSISNGAFQNCSSLTSIDLPEGLTSIGSWAFNVCTGLTSIALPEGLILIDGNAFYMCDSLKTINFKGTEDQWKAITKGYNWNYNCPSDMVINYNYQG
jgi:hypothetical protein